MNHFNTLRLLFLGLVVTLLQSCISQHKISISVLTPAQITLPQHITDVCIINHGIAELADSNGVYYSFARQLYYDSTKYDTLLSWSVIDGLVDGFAASYRLQIVGEPILWPRQPKDKEIFSFISDTLIDSLCTSADANAALIVDKISIFDNFDYFFMDNGLYYMELTALAAVSFQFYDLQNKQWIDQHIFMDTLTYSTYGYSWEKTLATLPGRAELYENIAYDIGKKYAWRLTPGLKTHQRFYYLSNDEDIRKGHEYASQNLWATAARYWIKLTDNKNKRKAYISAFNMAVASEMEGKLDIALYWIDKALEKYYTAEAVNYKTVLERRQTDLDLLIEQMKINP
jgi:hypothetical protein